MVSENVFELITPCFCAGANQGRAEIRAPSIRGELRWWFRVLGGTPDQESNVFGAVHGGAKASTLAVRVEMIDPPKSEIKDLPLMNVSEPLYYIYYFASASGARKGQRIARNAFLSPGVRFRVIFQRRLKFLRTPEETLLGKSLEAFRILGSIGLRQRRGCGAWACEGKQLGRADFEKWTSGLSGVQVYVLGMQTYPCGLDAQRELAKFLMAVRKKERLSGKTKTALGTSEDGRLASALHLRPVMLADGGIIPVVFYTPCLLPQGVQDVGVLIRRAAIHWPDYGKDVLRQQPRRPNRR